MEKLDLAPTPANLKAANRLLARIMDAIRAGVYRRENFFDTPGKTTVRTTFKAYAEEWRKTLVLERATIRNYGTGLKGWYKHFGDTPLQQVTPADIRKAVAARAKEVTGQTLNNHLSPLRAVFAMALADGDIGKDPVAGIKNVRKQKSLPDPLTAEERDLVVSYLRSRSFLGAEQVANYFELAFFTGMRPSELIVLRWGDIDWRRKKLRVSRARVDGEEKGTKTHTIRDIDLGERALATLTRQKVFTFMKGPEAEIFENPRTGKPWADPQLQRRKHWSPALRALGIRERDAYQTRHTFATLLLMGGVNPKWIQKQLGHASLAMLFEVYGTWIDDADGGAEARKANQVLGAKLSPNSPADSVNN